MKLFKCPNCKDVRNKDDDIILVQCGCGTEMEQVDSKHNPIDTRNKLMKICDENKCGSCPLRGKECF